MTENVVTVSPEKTLVEAFTLLRDSQVRHLPVLAGGKLVGIVTDRDVGKAVGALVALMLANHDHADVFVSDIMSKNVVTIDPLADLSEAARLIVENNVGALIVSPNGKPDKILGILSYVDLLKEHQTTAAPGTPVAATL